MIAHVFVTLKKGVLDPQGEAVTHALHSMKYGNVNSVRQGKYFELQLKGASKKEAEEQIKQMCEKLLANTVIEDFRVEIKE